MTRDNARRGLRLEPAAAVQHDHDAVEQLRLLDRLREIGGKAESLEPPCITAAAHRGHHDEVAGGELGILLDQRSEGLAVHHRHHHVQNHDAEGVAGGVGGPQSLERRLCTVDLGVPAAPSVEQARNDLAVGRVVVDREDTYAGDVDELARVLLCREHHGVLSCEPGREPEDRPDARLALHADLAAHQLHQAAADGEAEARAAVLPRRRGVGLRERIEQLVELRGGDADPGVAHLEAQHRFGVGFGDESDRDGDLTALGELEGVAEQVGEHLAQAPRVAAQRRRNVCVHERRELQAFAAGDERRQVTRVLHRVAQVEVQGLDLEFAGLDLGEVEDVVDDREQRLGAALHREREVALLRVKVRVEEQRRHPDDAVHGRADLVAHVGEELALGRVRGLSFHGQLVGSGDGELEVAVGRLGLRLGPAQCLLGGAPLTDISEGDYGADYGTVLGQRADHVLDREAGAVPAPQHLVVDAALGATSVGRVHRAVVDRVPPTIGERIMGGLVHAEAVQLRRGPAEQLLGGGVHEGDVALVVEAEDAVAGRLQQQPAALLGLGDGPLGPLAFGDVAGEGEVVFPAVVLNEVGRDLERVDLAVLRSVHRLKGDRTTFLEILPMRAP